MIYQEETINIKIVFKDDDSYTVLRNTDTYEILFSGTYSTTKSLLTLIIDTNNIFEVDVQEVVLEHGANYK